MESPVRAPVEHDVSGPKSQTTHLLAPVLYPEPMDSGCAGLDPDTPDQECPGSPRVVPGPNNLNIAVPFSTPDPALTIVTDASSYVWGDHISGPLFCPCAAHSG